MPRSPMFLETICSSIATSWSVPEGGAGCNMISASKVIMVAYVLIALSETGESFAGDGSIHVINPMLPVVVVLTIIKGQQHRGM
jgi:hypothetical protein